jgi:hypothetical protein
MAGQIILDTTKGFTFPVFTTIEKLAIATPNTGAVVFDTTLGKLCVYNGSAWQTVTSL